MLLTKDEERGRTMTATNDTLLIHRSPLPDVELPDGALTPYILRRANELADKPALVDGPTGRTLTYGELARAVASVAGGLVAKGFGRGDVLAIMSPNLPEYAVAFHGTAMAGGVVTTINPTYTGVRRTINSSIPVRRCSSRSRRSSTSPAKQPRSTSVEEIYVFGEADGARSFTELYGRPLERQVDVSPDDVVVAPLLLRDHRALQRGDADPPHVAREHPPDG